VFGIHELSAPAKRARAIRITCVILPILCWAMAAFIGKPLALVLIGGIAQAALLPFLAFAVIYLRYRRTPRELAPFSAIDPFLWLALVSTLLIGVHQFAKALGLLER
jgi:hypothetical protein